MKEFWKIKSVYLSVFLAGDCRAGAWGRTGEDTGLGILEPRAVAGDVSPKSKTCLNIINI